MDLKELEFIDPSIHWYYQTKAAAVRQALLSAGWDGGLIIDIGAGSGFFARELIREFPCSTATCVDPNYETEHLGTRDQLRFVRDVPSRQIQDASLLLFLDVLEHVEDDRALLRSYTQHASPGTLIAITVPAFMSMWSGHDVFLEHHRRYRRPQVVTLALDAGLEVLDSRYLYGSLFPVVWLQRKLRHNDGSKSEMRQPARILNGALRHLFGAEHRVPWNRLFGLTALVIAEVPASPKPEPSQQPRG